MEQLNLLSGKKGNRCHSEEKIFTRTNSAKKHYPEKIREEIKKQ
jgi:hypothetical protein